MKNCLFLFTVLGCVVTACQPRQAEPAGIGKVWKAQSVKQNGTVVYTEGNTGSIRPSYAIFRLDLTAKDQVIFTDLDAMRTAGKWTLSPGNVRLILENLVPAPSETTGTIEFYVTNAPTTERLELKRTTNSRKTGNSVNEYVLVPE